jgi:hypothetical protein
MVMGHREICFRKNKIITFCTHYHLHYLDQLAETKVLSLFRQKPLYVLLYALTAPMAITCVFSVIMPYLAIIGPCLSSYNPTSSTECCTIAVSIGFLCFLDWFANLSCQISNAHSILAKLKLKQRDGKHGLPSLDFFLTSPWPGWPLPRRPWQQPRDRPGSNA